MGVMASANIDFCPHAQNLLYFKHGKVNGFLFFIRPSLRGPLGPKQSHFCYKLYQMQQFDRRREIAARQESLAMTIRLAGMTIRGIK